MAAFPSYELRYPVGVVIAHPDDESMFFAPTLTALKRRGQRAAVLCLSSGIERARFPPVPLGMPQAVRAPATLVTRFSGLGIASVVNIGVGHLGVGMRLSKAGSVRLINHHRDGKVYALRCCRKQKFEFQTSALSTAVPMLVLLIEHRTAAAGFNSTPRRAPSAWCRPHGPCKSFP